ncbi:LOW QUALITY PROTEIN: oxidation resistance protein 1-like [Liolophura sinensis]|uniref:LOW QUALITY PROTEIN: oxidation resistance protein 1-like n=1 Tax=Liolophura sinensis TaxID=3198878 RepID=UPI003157FB00
MSDMERKPSLKERALERLGINALRQKAQTNDNVTTGSLLPSSGPALHNGQSGSQKQISISVIEGLRPSPKVTEMPQAPSEKKVKRQQPKGTIEYQVQVSNTLESIAAQFDTTPSELAKLNKLPSRMIFPGQVIYVPDPNHDSGSELSASPPVPSPPATFLPQEDKPRMDVPIIKMADRPPTKVPGHVERQTSQSSLPDTDDLPPRKLSEEEAKELDQECYERFIKVNVKHITDGQGVVNGVLLVTPNAIMFDPNVSDPLVIEHGPELYGMMAPMDTVISAAMYHDIAAMKLKGQAEEHPTDSPRREIYHGRDCPMAKICSNEIPEVKCYMEGKVSPERLQNLLVPLQSRASCPRREVCVLVELAKTQTPPTNQIPVLLCRKQLEEAKTSNQMPVLQRVPQILANQGCLVMPVSTEGKAVKDDGGSVSSSKPENESESESNVRLGQEGNLTKNQAEDDLGLRPLVFVDNCFDDSFRDAMHEASLQQLQTTLRELDLESSEITLDSSGTGTHADISGETSMYTSCSTDLSTNVTDDSLLDKRVLLDMKEDSKGPVSENKPVTSSPTQSQKEIHQEHSEDQIAPQGLSHALSQNTCKLETLRTSSTHLLRKLALQSKKGEETSLQRAPSKSDPIPMPDLSKEEVVEARSSSSFGSFTSSPHISAFVNYATGLFRSTADDHKLVKDITEVPPGETEVDGSVTSQTEATPVKAMDKGLESSDKHVNVENAVKLGDMPELFQSIEDTAGVTPYGTPVMPLLELIPRPAVRTDDPPLYLCLRVGKPIHQRVHSTGPIESYSRKKKKPEYWFSIPRNKVDQLYAFFVQWSPDKYGDEGDIDPASRGFVVVDEEDPEVGEDEGLDIFDEYFGPSSAHRIHRDWEIVNREEFRRRSIDVYEPLPLPELIGGSAILTEEHISQISKVLPGRAVGYPWTLVYSTETNGFSLKTLYRHMIGLEGPILLVVEDTGHNVFGALVACPLTMSEHFYGTGESFLYTFTPEFCVYKWTGENNFFIKGNRDSLAIGAGQGVFGLWFDEDLYHGRSNRCETYDNDPLTATEDFVLKGLEAWAFMV